MSWAGLVSGGSGFIDFRLMVEGWPHQWVTHSRIAPDSGSEQPRTIYPGLSFDGLRISERMILREGWPDVAGITAKIVPTDSNEDTLNGFTRNARPVAELTLTLEPADAAWTTRPTGLAAGNYHIATEAVTCDGSDGLTRAIWNTLPQQHKIDDGIIPQPVSIYAWPPSMEGRHAYLYAYTPGDDPTGLGTNVWRGVVTQPPRMESDGLTWTIDIAPITKQFDQVLGSSDAIEYRVRGIYHSDRAPITIFVGTSDIDLSVLYQEIPTVRVMGFFETDADLDKAVNDALAVAVAAASAEPNAQYVGYIRYNSTTGTPYYTVGCSNSDFPITIITTDNLNGDTWKNSPGSPASNGSPVSSSGILTIQAGDANGAFVVLGNSSLTAPWQYPLPLARALLGARVPDLVPYIYRDRDINSQVTDPAYPHDRVYLSSVEGLSVGDTLVAKNGDADVRTMVITAIDATERFITATFIGDTGIYLCSETTIVPMRIYGEDTHWAGFMESVAEQAPQANQGNTPWLNSADLYSLVGWYLKFLFYPIPEYWRHRSYKFIKQVRVRDVLAPELLVTGFMARLSLDGRLDVAELPFVSAVRSADHQLTDDEILLPSDGQGGMFPTWEAQSDGLVNIAKVHLGYNPISDEFNEHDDFTVRVVASIAEHKSGDKASQEIEIRSTPASRTINYGKVINLTLRQTVRREISSTEVVDAVTPYLRCLSTDYATVTVAVPFTKFNVLMGDIVQVTSEFVPNGLGSRGVTAAKSICVGRTWDLDPAATGMGTLTLWFPRNPATGYAPTGRITSQTGFLTSWVLTLDPTDDRNIAWAEDTAGGDVVRHFAADDVIQIVQVDSLTPTIVTGLITATAAGEITVELDDTWDPDVFEWNLRFAYVSAQFIDRQQAYCWVADDNAQLADNSPAREFA